jgi:hypothetical protein
MRITRGAELLTANTQEGLYCVYGAVRRTWSAGE